jgi:predicted short-subunit dehydrogenase-like oxidoreductase (DUF2520 family)
MRIALIGNGNLAWHLSTAFRSAGLHIDMHLSRSNDQSLGWTLVRSWSEMPADMDLYLLAVPDAGIAEASSHIDPNAAVVHFSGGTSIEAIPHQHRAVCWPCQTLTKGTVIDYSTIPVVFECSDSHTCNLIDRSLRKAWGTWTEANAQQRMMAHVAAVFSNNFTNHMQHIAHGLLHEAGLPTHLLHPMVKAHMSLLDKHEPGAVQTGPAKRNDVDTIQRHIALLQSHPDWKKLYESNSEDIIETHRSNIQNTT